MIKLNQSLHRLQVAWREAQQSSSPTADSLREQFERLMTIYLSTKAAMTEPQMLQNCLHLQVSMAVILVQLAVGNHGTEPVDLVFPLPEVENSRLAYVPGNPSLLQSVGHCPSTGLPQKDRVVCTDPPHFGIVQRHEKRHSLICAALCLLEMVCATSHTEVWFAVESIPAGLAPGRCWNKPAQP